MADHVNPKILLLLMLMSAACSSAPATPQEAPTEPVAEEPAEAESTGEEAVDIDELLTNMTCPDLPEVDAEPGSEAARAAFCQAVGVDDASSEIGDAFLGEQTFEEPEFCVRKEESEYQYRCFDASGRKLAHIIDREGDGKADRINLSYIADESRFTPRPKPSMFPMPYELSNSEVANSPLTGCIRQVRTEDAIYFLRDADGDAKADLAMRWNVDSDNRIESFQALDVDTGQFESIETFSWDGNAFTVTYAAASNQPQMIAGELDDRHNTIREVYSDGKIVTTSFDDQRNPKLMRIDRDGDGEFEETNLRVYDDQGRLIHEENVRNTSLYGRVEMVREQTWGPHGIAESAVRTNDVPAQELWKYDGKGRLIQARKVVKRATMFHTLRKWDDAQKKVVVTMTREVYDPAEPPAVTEIPPVDAKERTFSYGCFYEQK